jgi:Uma2 family endonuclease
MSRTAVAERFGPLPPLLDGIPILYEDDIKEELGMGENSLHYIDGNTIFAALQAHCEAHHPEFRVFANLNCYYLESPRNPTSKRSPYVCPDVMVVRPDRPLGESVDSYTIGKDGPAPVLVVEVLSKLSGKLRDPIEKPDVYARLGIPEYLLIDEPRRFLDHVLVLKKLRDDRTWDESIDADGGVTSRLGFRVVHDGVVRVFDESGRAYVRPVDAEREIRSLEEALEISDRTEERLAAEKQMFLQRIRELEEENARLKGQRPEGGQS